jgi:TatD DNase family protein
MYLIDTHTHIYLSEFDNDRTKMMQRATESGVELIIMPAIDSSTHEAMIKVESDFENCFSMIGLHPCSVKQDFEMELNIVKDFLEKRKFIAVGEIGLDFYWDKTFIKEQYEAFHSQIKISLKHDIPIVIHSRNATDECIAVVKEYPGLKGVFHCFSGNYEQAMQIIDTGFVLGIGGVVTFKNSGLDKIVEKIGLSNVILETDSPYLAPVPFRGKRNEVSYTAIVAEKLAAICNCSKESVADLTTKNAKNLFKL